MTFEQRIPHPPFDKQVALMIYFHDFMPPHAIERVIPTGHSFLIFEFDGQQRHTYDNKTLEPNATYSKAWISGMHRNYISISAHEHSEMFVIQFKAGGLYPFLHTPVDALTEKVVAAQDIFGNELLMLYNSLAAAPGPAEKFKVAEAWLSERYDEQKQTPGELLLLISELQEQPASNLKNIVSRYPNTQKHLISQFKKYVGLTPKYYQRILRFNDILQRINHKEHISWPDITYQCGFADQSHFIKEFKHFSGFNPREFIAKDHHRQEPNFFPAEKQG